jgi:hypothetical protein
LSLLEQLFLALKLIPKARDYRDKFSKAYKNLFEQKGGPRNLCFIYEIIDSAQQNYRYLWVNGEKYVFS